VYKFCHGSVDTPIDVCRHTPWWCRHTPAETQNCEFIWTRGHLGFKGICLGFCAHVPKGSLWSYGAINTHVFGTPKHPTQDKSQELSGRREEERERGICIQRSRAAPPREEEEEEGEEEELGIVAVLIQKEI
ncbi:hypothetical protein Taro_015018, partial [Colocasia esculenta]|nr:hypothetical protein [Colocasia esculenta]